MSISLLLPSFVCCSAWLKHTHIYTHSHTSTQSLQTRKILQTAVTASITQSFQQQNNSVTVDLPYKCLPSLRHCSATTILLILLMWITWGYPTKQKGLASGWQTFTTTTVRYVVQVVVGRALNRWGASSNSRGHTGLHVKLILKEIFSFFFCFLFFRGVINTALMCL